MTPCHQPRPGRSVRSTTHAAATPSDERSATVVTTSRLTVLREQLTDPRPPQEVGGLAGPSSAVVHTT